MYKLCKTERSAARQREIELALLDLMTKRRFEDITVSELCDYANVPRKAFYRYFDSKDGALRALIEHSMSAFGTSTPTLDDKRPRSLTREIAQFFIFWKEQRTLLSALERSGLFSLLIDAAIDFPIRDVISLSRFLPEDSENMRHSIFKFAICGLMFTMLSWYKSGFAESPHEMARTSCRMLSQPLFPNLEKLGIQE